MVEARLWLRAAFNAVGVIHKLSRVCQLLNRVFYSQDELGEEFSDFLLATFLLHLEQASRLVVQVEGVNDRHYILVVHINRNLIRRLVEFGATILVDIDLELDDEADGLCQIFSPLCPFLSHCELPLKRVGAQARSQHLDK